MDNKVLNKFYNELIEEASMGNILCGFYMPILFETTEMRYTKLNPLTRASINVPNIMIPTVVIRDKNKLDNSIMQYNNLAKEFYKDDIKLNSTNEPEKYIITSLLSNALLNDFDDINKLFLRQIEYIKNVRLNDFYQTKDFGYNKTLCGNIIAKLAKEPLSVETPTSFNSSIEIMINNKLFFYDLPCIRVGITSNEAIIYSVQKVKDRELPSYLRNDKDYLIELKNYQDAVEKVIISSMKTTDVDANVTLAMIILLSVLELRDIKKIIVPSILLNRYNSLEISCRHNMDKLNNTYEEAVIKNQGAIAEDSLNKISNIKKTLDTHEYTHNLRNEKMIKIFKYLDYIFSDYNIYGLPMQQDTSLNFYITDNKHDCKIKFLNELKYQIQNSIEMNHK